MKPHTTLVREVIERLDIDALNREQTRYRQDHALARLTWQQWLIAPWSIGLIVGAFGLLWLGIQLVDINLLSMPIITAVSMVFIVGYMALGNRILNRYLNRVSRRLQLPLAPLQMTTSVAKDARYMTLVTKVQVDSMIVNVDETIIDCEQTRYWQRRLRNRDEQAAGMLNSWMNGEEAFQLPAAEASIEPVSSFVPLR